MSAVRNNAEWCDIVCRTHGINGTFHPHVWASEVRTPPYYPDAVTLDRAATVGAILSSVDTSTPGCSVKDSFASLDLSSAGFRIIFESDWIRRAPGQLVSTRGDAVNWRRVGDGAELQSWEAAWSDDGVATGLFRPALLDHVAVAVLGGYAGDRLIAGAIANRSHGVVGVSNLYATGGDVDAAWSGCLAVVSDAWPRLPVVGYESGAALVAAHRAGFTSTGRLRVWRKDEGA